MAEESIAPAREFLPPTQEQTIGYLESEVEHLRVELADVMDRDTAAFESGSAALKEAQEVIKRLGAEKDAAQLEHECSEATLAMAVARLGGQVEGAPTHQINFLQRIDELRRVEEQRDALADALGKARALILDMAFLGHNGLLQTFGHKPGSPVENGAETLTIVDDALKLAGRLP